MKRILSFLALSFAFLTAFAQAPANYYNGTAGLTGAALKTKLSQIIYITNYIGYGGLWNAYYTTDRDLYYEGDNTVLDIYSENPTGPDPYNFTMGTNQCGQNGPEGTCYNREHIVPQSLFGSQNPMYSDIHFIRPTDSKVNGMRSNYPFGKVSTPSYTSLNGSKLGASASPGYTSTVFEPIDEFKGDVARMIFYFVTRYESQLSTFSSGGMLGNTAYPGLQTWERDQLLAWHLQDPVSPTEIARNNASYTVQGNRNPFIDHPEFASQIWGNPVIDTEAPTIPTNLVANNPTSSSVAVSWTASTDNIGVVAYEVYANGVLKTTVSGTSTTVTGLSPLTQYTFYVIAKDAAGNSSPQSATATQTTLDGPAGSGSCGTEDFSTMLDGSSSPSSYATRTWTNNNITWTATLARTDETINGKAVCTNKGTLTSSLISGGVQTLTLTTQRKYSGNNGNLNVYVNDVLVGTIPYSTTVTTTPITVGVGGDVVIKIVNPNSGDRVAMDDLTWTCFNTLGTIESQKDKSAFTIYPNPVRNNELFVKGENLGKISKADIYDFSGKLIETIANPFKHSNKINLKGLVKGTYILKTDNFSTKFIVD
ncbi:T9SS type A sorting domain-containing protein [Chryseobacterium sp. Tr-659]|uniref:endonuclease n=1 Tax=Chryseobacterium sp. Tr-659 TaxID=2608340 RepID=UPI0014242FF8|nr:endonuclease [Chryseobacterium sp. Tr-659]NIF07083.1 T9SS type A sorting domain-containing protein [Chryseobacterium sp. Tr-659]